MNHKNAVLQGLENMKDFDGHGDGIQYYSNDGVPYTVNQMIDEVKNDTKIGNEFSMNVYNMCLAYMGKFSQDAE